MDGGPRNGRWTVDRGMAERAGWAFQLVRGEDRQRIRNESTNADGGPQTTAGQAFQPARGRSVNKWGGRTIDGRWMAERVGRAFQLVRGRTVHEWRMVEWAADDRCQTVNGGGFLVIGRSVIRV